MRSITGRLRFPVISVAILLANVLGTPLYLLGARHAWVIPEEKAIGISATTGEPFVWASFVWPVWGVFLALNLAWGAMIVARRRWLDGRIWLMAFFIWVVAVIIDFTHR